MVNPAPANIVDVLLTDKIITPEVASQVKLESLNTGEQPEKILIKKNLVSPEEVTKAKAKILGVPFVTLSACGISPEILNFIPEPVARRYTLFPFDYGKTKDELQVAMVDPLDLQVIEFLEKKSGKKIIPCLAQEQDIKQTIEEKYAASLGKEVTEALRETAPAEVKTIDASKIGEIIREAPIARIVSTLLEYAVKSRASDIHIEPLERKTRVRYRIDGVLHEKLALPKSVHDAVVSRIKILSDMKIDEKRIPQDGRFNFKLGEEEVDLRISTLPTAYGEKVVMRLLKKTGGIPSLPKLGLRGIALKNLKFAISRPHGIILVTGPTGSGKTTTLYSVLSELNTTKVNIITLEDPVEYEIPGVNQVQVNPAAGLTFATGLRSFLRQDPNIILVGEIRDRETTQLAIQAALTGHLVFSTLHTNSAAQSIDRILDIFPASRQNLVRMQLSGTLEGIISQRLLPAISGGRIPACEILLATSAIKSAIREGKTHLIDNIIQTSGDLGMRLFEQSLADLVKKGKITRKDAEAYALRLVELNRLL